MGITGYFAWRNGQKAVQDLAGQLRGEVSDRIDQHLDDYLNIPQHIVAINVDAFNSGILDVETPSELERFFWTQATYQEIGYVILGLETGDFLAVGHFFGDDRLTLDRLDQSNPDQGGLLYSWPLDRQGHKEGTFEELGSFEPQKEGWYVEAIKENEKTWSPVYNWLVEPYKLSIAFSQPIYSQPSSELESPKLLGVVAAEQQLGGISEFLQGLEISRSGQTFIIEQSGLLIGSSAPEAPFKLEAGQPKRLDARESPDPLIQATAQFLHQEYPDLKTIEGALKLEFIHEGERQFVQVTPWQDELGLDWLMVVVMPENDFMAQIQANTRNTLMLCALALVIATGLGVCTSHWITTPLLRLSHAAEAIALQATTRANAGERSTHSFNPTELRDREIYRFQELERLSQSFSRMTLQLQSAFDGLTHSATHDALTGLPNRFALENHLNAHLEKKSAFALLFLDLDYFKLVNDSLGHEVGDRLLQAVADRLINNLPVPGLVARFGGDEFVILLSPTSLREGEKDLTAVAIETAKQLIQQTQEPFALEEHEVFVGTSIGIVASTQLGLHTMTAQEALRNADTALYRAKANGKGSYAVFDNTMYLETLYRLQLETDLRQAIQQQLMELYYQPIVDVQSLEIQGFEALIRWWNPRVNAYVSPEKFIAVAEETGLILPLTEWVVETACRQMKAWQQQFSHCAPMVMHVNVSSQQFLQANWVPELVEVLQKTELAPTCLGLEITERTLMGNGLLTKIKLKQLEQAGIHISIDDFGTGYSSLGYLQQFPIHSLKIDRSFVSKLDHRDSGDNAIIGAITAMAHNLGLSLIAEGVETEVQLKLLSQLGCQQFQGYLFSAARCTEEVTALLLAQAAIKQENAENPSLPQAS